MLQNWFQNRRAKVKHEEKKQRNSIPSWQDSLSTGIPLSENGLINDAFMQTQNLSCAPEAVDFSVLQPHSTNSADGSMPYAHTTTIGDCPPIEEEPIVQDSDMAFMNFFGIENHLSRNVQLQEVNQISRQFNPQIGLTESIAATPNAPSSYQDSGRQSIAATYSQNASSTNPMHLHDRDAATAPPIEGPRTPSAFIPVPGIAPDTSLFRPNWTISQPTHQETPFDLQQAKDMVNQLKEQTSQEHVHKQHAFRCPTSQTHVANPQPVALSQSLGNGSSLEARAVQARSGQQEQEQPQPVDEFKTPARCDSGSSLLAEDMIEAEATSAKNGVPPRTSSTSSLSLAQRRQRRPANISAGASRSYSSSQASATASDRGINLSDAADPRFLRRIKSSSGVLNGRIQKSGQRSPLHQWTSPEGNPHLNRQLSAGSLNTAVLKHDDNGGFGHPPPVTSYPATMHMHHPSNGSGLTHMTIAEDNSQGAESIWSRMPSTAGTANTSIYHSLPQTANTTKSYASPPHSPMDPSQLEAMHLHQVRGPHSLPPGFPGFQPQPVAHAFPAHGLISPHGTPSHAPGQPGFSTEDLLLNTIPAGQLPTAPQPPAFSERGHHHQLSNSQPIGPMEANSSIMSSKSQPFPHWTMNGLQPVPVQDYVYHPEIAQLQPSQHLIWNVQVENGTNQLEHTAGEDLQIHQFTPQNPVEPSALPPKQKGASPRQNYSFQNFGPSFYSSPKSQSSHSKASSPGPLHISG